MKRSWASAAGILLVIAVTGSAAAQIYIPGPPIPAEQVLRQQNTPLPPVPQIPVPVRPAPPISGEPYALQPSAPQLVPTAPLAREPRDRASLCQHQATVEGVRRRDRAAYINSCISR